MSLFPIPDSHKAVVKVTLKDEVLDPQGKAVLSVLKSSGFNNIEDVRVGKHIELTIGSNTPDRIENSNEYDSRSSGNNKYHGKNSNNQNIGEIGELNKETLSKELKDISEKILSNPLIENFEIEIK
ncbi:MAG: phosphoribosylformylglycinamidine synthase subunit PurS [bacterium]